VDITVSAESITQYSGDAVVVGVVQKGLLSGPAAEADTALGGLVTHLIDSGEIRGRAGELTVLHTQGRLPASRVAVAGLGEASQLDLYVARRVMAAAARQLRDRGCRRIATTLHRSVPGQPRPQMAVRAVIEAAYLGLYRGEERKTEPGPPDEFDELRLITTVPADVPAAQKAAETARLAGEATNYARRLVNLPGNEITPARLADEALRIAEHTGAELEVLAPEELRARRMGALLAVGQGSANPPRLISLRYRGRQQAPLLAFVGKGITFDSGGISIKPSENMHLMKQDMAGAAAVLAAAWAIAKLKLPVDLLAVVPTAENMPGSGAYRPGDVVDTHSGKTVEVISTDAEGRLILADALSYARESGATHMVDLATLTGACIIALGYAAAAILGNDSGVVEALLDAGEQAGERMWRLPLFPEYRRQLDSTIADLKNVGGRPAGTITGGWFLREFVGETSWAHIDIAGTAWSEKEEAHQVEGATGSGTRTLIAFAERLAGAS
jgi:leucyl aminopeptidase